MSIQTVNSEILASNFTNDQLTSIIDAVRYARAQLGKRSIRALSIGDNVNFNSTKLGRNVTGVVTKIAIKYVTVKTVAGLWRVPANMLTVVEDEREFA
jgi:small-conductance mechanosensitive channel